jgi:lipopolysaccharide export system protein LptA
MFSGDARAWQGRNFINAENIEIFRAEKRMTASGNVRSSVLDARPRSSGASSVPVFGTAQKLSYDANRKTVVYEGQAELRQGGDRIAGEKLTAFLGDSNDIERAVAEGSVSVTQPGRRASGEFAEYSVRDERVVLRGNPARVADDKTGSSEASELTVNLRDRSVVGEGSQKADSSGRTRTVYKVNRQR